MNLAPIYISFMLTCSYSPRPADELGEDHWNSPSGLTVREWLKTNGLVDNNYQATDRGYAWVSMITKTPLPESQWVDPRNGEAAHVD